MSDPDKMSSWFLPTLTAVALVAGFLFLRLGAPPLPTSTAKVRQTVTTPSPSVQRPQAQLIPESASRSTEGRRPIFRWVDQQGNVHFGDRAPTNIRQVEAVHVEPNVMAFEPAPAITPAYTAPSRDSGVARQSERDSDGARQAACSQAEAELKRLRAKMRHGYPASMSRYYYDRELALRNRVRDHCG
jgi:hypothetical protein